MMMFKWLLVSLLAVSSLQAKETICLNMIVKNEAHVITRALDSVKDWIDYWVIVDTGSTDGTQGVILEHMKGHPGELHERPWKDFGHNRTEALDLARDKGDYILFLDADDWIEFRGVEGLPKLTASAYSIRWEHKGGVAYDKPQLVRSDLPWKWVGVLHEYLDCNTVYVAKGLEGVVNCYGADGARSQNPKKYDEAAEVLKKALEEEPDNSRYVFYLGESLNDAGRPFEAREVYKRRVEMGEEDEEVFFALLRIAMIELEAGFDFDQVAEGFMRAHRCRPHRPEPIFYLAELYNTHEKPELAYELIHGWKQLPKEETQNVICRFEWTEEWGIDYELFIATEQLGKTEECIATCRPLLSKKVPAECREKLEKAYEQIGFKEDQSVMIAILARNKAHVLPTFLNCIENLDYDKRKITLYINTNNNCDETEELLEKWAARVADSYAAVLFEHIEVENLNDLHMHNWNPDKWKKLGAIRNRSLEKAKSLRCSYYFVCDCDNFVAPETLRYLVNEDKPIIAPLLRSVTIENDPYCNFFPAINENGYCKNHPDYDVIFNRKKKGSFQVPLVHQVYLVKTDCIDRLTYIDGSDDWEFIIFAKSAREAGVEQYICNALDFGTFLHFPENPSLDEEKQAFEELCKNRTQFDRFGFDDRIKMGVAEIPTTKSIQKMETPWERANFFTTLAQIHEIQNKSEEEILAAYESAHKNFPLMIDPLYFLSKYYDKKREYDKSYDAVLKAFGARHFTREGSYVTDSALNWHYSIAAYKAGHFSEACRMTEQLIKDNADNPGPLNRLKRNLGYMVAGEQIFKFAREKWGAPPWEGGRPQGGKVSFKPNPQAKLHLCTCASHHVKNLDQLLHSCNEQGIELDIVGMGKPFSFGMCLREFKTYLEALPEDDIVLFIDAYDVLILADAETLLEKFHKMQVPYTFSAETNCHPFPHVANIHPETASRFKYLNSGSYMGYVAALKQIFEEISPIPDETDDQGLLMVYFLYHPEQMILDTDCELFIPLVSLDRDDLKLDLQQKTVDCLVTKTRPSVIHGNGSSKALYQQVYEELFENDPTLTLLENDPRKPHFERAFDLMESRGLHSIVELGSTSSDIFKAWAEWHREGSYHSYASLEQLKEPVDLLYLDCTEFNWADPQSSQKKMLKEVKRAYKFLSDESVVMIDGWALPFGGQGKLVAEFLETKGWSCLDHGFQAIYSR